LGLIPGSQKLAGHAGQYIGITPNSDADEEKRFAYNELATPWFTA
jgi:hypothetical protein